MTGPVDIMLPFYGDPGLLRRAVRSVLEQRDPDWRLTVVDDGYPDETIEPWFAGLGDERVRYRRNAVNLGAQPNNRYCLELVDAELFVMMGADDLMLPHYLDTVRALHTRFPDTAVVQPGVQVIDDSDRPVRPLADVVKGWLAPRGSGPREVGGEALAASLLRGNWLYNPSLCWRTAALGTIPESADVFDLALPLGVIAAGGTLLVDDEVCFRYRRHRTSDSGSGATAGNRFPEEKRFFAAAAERMDARGWPKAAAAARGHLTSRLNAAVQLPGAVARRDTGVARVLGRHLVSR
ncbi:glycosyltransferase family 2 protein [Pseudonocardia endophytica]|uniref:Glycosyl transferase family 2 n=1 Tax=Pseudonocardia endophytica TaxID=401976 RepID=A0A4R1HYA1_PSEEN|nr:glycosyltransferase family 2 protein [Pseudonocardia endophytica]TCK27378.1 glycosyl transferase family 2 [Pseudonocardia endophytica]